MSHDEEYKVNNRYGDGCVSFTYGGPVEGKEKKKTGRNRVDQSRAFVSDSSFVFLLFPVETQ